MASGQLIAAAVMAMTLSATPIHAADPAIANPDIVVRGSHGVYSVVARFRVSQPREVALAVLTDYERIPQFMPGVDASVVVERAPGRVVVAQEATSRFMLFKKRVFLLLEIDEAANALVFRDHCGRSFKRYDGAWHLSDVGGGTEIEYTLTAEPGFDVPDFVLKRLLQRDSGAMIDGLRREIEHRAGVVPEGSDAEVAR